MFVVLHCKDLMHVSELITALGGGGWNEVLIRERFLLTRIGCSVGRNGQDFWALGGGMRCGQHTNYFTEGA